MVTIRFAELEDAGVLADLGRQTFHDTFAAHNTPEDMAAYMAEAFAVEQITAELCEPGSVCLLAEMSPNVIGFARLMPTPAPSCITGTAPVRLMKLYVASKAIGTGVGAALMRACIEWAKENGYRCLWLGVWEQNDRAKAFYKRWGFVSVGNESFRLGTDDQNDVLMQLTLSKSL